jgi:hypothetical protein
MIWNDHFKALEKTNKKAEILKKTTKFHTCFLPTSTPFVQQEVERKQWTLF